VRGRVAAVKIDEIGPKEDQRPNVSPAARVVRSLSESAGARRLSAFGRRPDRSSGRCMNAVTSRLPGTSCSSMQICLPMLLVQAVAVEYTKLSKSH
jgi:hypothetical protein